MSDDVQGERMFGIKLVGAPHFGWPFFRSEGNPPLINFPNSPAGRRIAAAIPTGHRSLVYVMHPVRRFKASIEYVNWDPKCADVLEEGARAAASQGAVVLMGASNPDFGFREGEIMRDVRQQEYLEGFNAVPWSWTDGGN